MTSVNDSTLMPAALRDTRRMNQFVSVAAAVAGLLFGLDIGVIAGALPFITDHFTLSNRLQEWVVSSMMLGAAIGALFNGWLSFRLGRKYSLMVGAILFVAGSIGSAFATNVEVLLLSRVLLGVAVGIASYTAPLYLSEMASENVRGKMISMYQLMVTLGIVLAFLSDTYFSYSGNWRAMLGVLALPAVLLIVLVIFLPNSPRWLAQKGRHVEAEEVLRMLRDTSEKAREELNEIRESLKLKQGGWSLFKANHYASDPATLSGGERARVSLLRALLAQPQALLLDEPFSRLDKTLRASFRAWVFEVTRQRRIPVVLVTHDEDDIPPGGEVIEISRWQ